MNANNISSNDVCSIPKSSLIVVREKYIVNAPIAKKNLRPREMTDAILSEL